MPYNNDFNAISKSYSIIRENEADKKLLFEFFDISEEQYKDAPLLSTIEEMDAYYSHRDNNSNNSLVNENNNSAVVLKYLQPGENII